MSGINQLNFVKTNIYRIQGPILEVGSKIYGKTSDYRSLFPNFEYIGLDMEDGKGVDVVLDLTEEFFVVNRKLNGKRFKTIFCISVLEHCSSPFKMCDNITRLLDREGLVFVSVPFSWRIHDYPGDYWRFTPQGIKILFPELNFDIYDGNLSTCRIGEVGSINDSMFRVEMSILKSWKHRDFVGVLVGLYKKLKILPKRLRYSYLFPPVMVNMIGKRKKERQIKVCQKIADEQT